MSTVWITTKGGDKGMTSLGNGTRVPKDDERVELYGTIDECQACIGTARAICRVDEVREKLTAIEKDLYRLMGVLSLYDGSIPPDVALLDGIVEASRQVCGGEFAFVLPGESQTGAALHLARTVARRAERRAMPLLRRGEISQECFIYINRLSDALFALILWNNKRAAEK